jgi:low affinity Fe/Cu permease
MKNPEQAVVEPPARHPTPRRLSRHAPRRGEQPRGFARVRCAFDTFAGKVTKWAGSPIAFVLAVMLVLVWCISGPFFGYSETWQLVINTGTTIITFLMVFLIQQSQNKDSAALHLKLDELIRAIEAADDNLVDIEELNEDELKKLSEHYRSMADNARSLAAKGKRSEESAGDA